MICQINLRLLKAYTDSKKNPNYQLDLYSLKCK